MTFTRGIVTYAAIATLFAEAVAAVLGCGVVAPILVLKALDDRGTDNSALVGTVGIGFFALLGLVVAIWSVWAALNLRDRLRTGAGSRAGLIGSAGLHVAVSAAALLVPLVLAVTVPALALLGVATAATRPARGTRAPAVDEAATAVG
ncbi:hypothetical protein ACFRCG_21880 [Embleya sp. NPDC056575]|uniref:hypothetical protein n=1 Tax=unclassified Embleya TaxID=2699296 RepID=UPI003689A067